MPQIKFLETIRRNFHFDGIFPNRSQFNDILPILTFHEALIVKYASKRRKLSLSIKFFSH